jgi:hypothetical protein
MLILHPNCQCCDKDLPADAKNAVICSFECTFVKIALSRFIEVFAQIFRVTLRLDLQERTNHSRNI